MNSLQASIESLNHRLLDTIPDDYPFGLAQGKMGLIIYLYHLYDYTREMGYKEKADSLLDVLFEKDLSKDSNLTVEEGLCGVGLGLGYLIRNRFVDGDINELTTEIDDLLFQQIVFDNPEPCNSLPEMTHWLYYLYQCMEDQTDKEELFVWEELSMKLVNKVATLLDASFFTESFTFSLYSYHVPILLRIIAYLLRKDFYSDRLLKILEQISLYLFAHQPRLQLNRLYLLWGVLPLRRLSPLWQQYTDSMKRGIDLSHILTQEIKGNNIYISNGFPCLYGLLESLKRCDSEYAFAYDPHLIYNLVVNSEAWEVLKYEPYYYQIHCGLLNGFPGTVLTLLDLKKKYL